MSTPEILLVVAALAALVTVLILLRPSELELEIARVLKLIIRNGKDTGLSGKDRREIHSLIQRYNQAVERALNFGDLKELAELCTDPGYQQVWQLYNEHYQDRQVGVSLAELKFISANVTDTGEAEAHTQEKWIYKYATGVHQEREGVNRYRLCRSDGDWKVHKVEVFVSS